MALNPTPFTTNKQVEMDCLVKRTVRVLYDNGITPGSSSNTGGTRSNLVRFDWTFESLGWETDQGLLGIGDTIGIYNGWSPQLQGWVDFGQTHYPNQTSHTFDFLPAPTWRSWNVVTCNPNASFGKWELQRLDGLGGVYTIYPILPQITYDVCYKKEICDDKGKVIEIQWYKAIDEDTFELIETPDDADCYVSKDFPFPDPIMEGAVSPCTQTKHYLCDTANDDTQIIMFIDDCPGQPRVKTAYLLDDYNNATDPEISEYDLDDAELVLLNPVTGEKGDPFVEPSCNTESFSYTICATPKQYANIVTISGSGSLSIFDQISQEWTDYGTVTLPGGGTLGSFSMDVLNDASDPKIIIQSRGGLYSLSIDPETCEPLSTESAYIGPHNNSSFGGSYPVGAFKPGTTDYYVALGSGATLGIANVDTGTVITLGQLTDTRDGAPASLGFGDAFFDPSGKFYGFARDNRGASFINPVDGNPYSTGTVLWCIDPVALTATRVGQTDAPTSGTGAAWISAGVYALSTSGGTIYYYRPAIDTVPGSVGAWTTEIPTSPVSINDLGNLWKRPDPITVFICGEKCEGVITKQDMYQIIQNDDGTSDMVPFTLTLPLDWGKCEPDANPYITDPFDAGGDSSGLKPTDKVWHEGCWENGYVSWREDCEGVREYIYGASAIPTPEAPENFLPFPCGSVNPIVETTQWCNEDVTPNTTAFRREDLITGEIVWYDETGVISEPALKTPGDCKDLDPLLPVSEEVVCWNDESYIRVVKERYQENADGLAELVDYQIIFFNENGIGYDSGILAAEIVSNDPTDWYIGDCVDPYVRTEDVKLCEIDARYLLLIDSGGNFARYSFLTERWETVSTLSVASAGGSADVENFLLYNFVAPDQMTVIDVNTDTQLPNITIVDGVINPAVTTNPKTFSAAAFRDSDGCLYAWDTAGADAGLYKVNVQTGVVDFVTTISGVSGTGTSIAIDNSTDRLIINGTSNAYEVDFVTGLATVWDTLPIRANGSTFDDQGNFYVSAANDTYCRNANTGVWTQIIDDWTPGANSIAFYKVEAPKPSCFIRRYGFLSDGSKECIGDFQYGTKEDISRTIVGEVVCCEEPSISSSSSEVSVINDPQQQLCEGSTGYLTESVKFPITYWTLEGVDDNGFRNREWENTFTVTGVSGSNTAFGSNVRENHDFSESTTVDNFANSMGLNDSNNTASLADMQVRDGYIVVSPSEAGTYRYTTNSEGYFAIELGLCCGSLELLAELGKTVGVNTQPEFDITEGIHKIRLWNIDSAGSNSNWNLQKLEGATWIDANTFFTKTSTKPSWSCNDGWICGNEYQAFDGTPLVFTDVLVRCEPSCFSSSNGSSESAFECPDEVTQTIETGTGVVPAGLKSVTINNISGTTTIAGGFELGAGRRVEAISFDSTNHSCINGVLPAITVTGGTWQWIGIR